MNDNVLDKGNTVGTSRLSATTTGDWCAVFDECREDTLGLVTRDVADAMNGKCKLDPIVCWDISRSVFGRNGD